MSRQMRACRAFWKHWSEGETHMCLSTIYRDSVEQDNMVMKNVRLIEYRDGMIVLTDLMERQISIQGELVMANLVDGVAVIREKQPLPA